MKYNLKTLWDVAAQITIVLANEENLSSGSKEILNTCLDNLNCLLSQQCKATVNQLKSIEDRFSEYLNNVFYMIDESDLSKSGKLKMHIYTALAYFEKAYEMILSK